MTRLSHIALCLTVIGFAMINLAWTPWGAIYDAARDERGLADQAADKEISLSIKAKLADRDAKKALGVKVYSFLGNVYLVGALDDPGFQVFALETAKSTDGVRNVKRHFVRKSDTMATDLEIAAKVRTRLVAEKDFSSTQVETEVFNGEVIMLGMVRSRNDEATAKRIARDVDGVRKVTSFLIPSE
ncbi:BON domain-containing protein [Pseudodesulfovibrio tunisiensis]|uniref:BON domain-containing protein n=1 Tax=Pseudodesulfovibrio tunisiensis TaxID=463192 RepID=UPI001FB33948|nr:BON domain-containing protein [Pseudodesulfovibrio tunisiensis]